METCDGRGDQVNKKNASWELTSLTKSHEEIGVKWLYKANASGEVEDTTHDLL